jgi:hypothetical protein
MTICRQCQIRSVQRLVSYGHPQEATERYGKVQKATERYGNQFFSISKCQHVSVSEFLLSVFYFLQKTHLKPVSTHLISHLKHAWDPHFTEDFTLVHLFRKWGVPPSPPAVAARRLPNAPTTNRRRPTAPPSPLSSEVLSTKEDVGEGRDEGEPADDPRSLTVAYSRLQSVANQAPRSVTVGYGRLWSVMVGYGRLWSAMVACFFRRPTFLSLFIDVSH